jgi:hypothetical protein
VLQDVSGAVQVHFSNAHLLQGGFLLKERAHVLAERLQLGTEVLQNRRQNGSRFDLCALLLVHSPHNLLHDEPPMLADKGHAAAAPPRSRRTPDAVHVSGSLAGHLIVNHRLHPGYV